MSGPPGLPPFVNVDGAWEDVRDRLYAEFEAVFKCAPSRQVVGRPLIFDTRMIDDNREEGFWHVITKGKGGDRLFDPDRARRICFIAHILDDTAPGLTRWRYVEGDGSTKLYFWLRSQQYVLILAERKNVVSLVTAFYVEGWFEKDLQKKLDKGTIF